jgi:predicted DNA-binding protein YlxM (UPF0122 family)
MFTNYEQKLHMITYYKQAYVYLLRCLCEITEYEKKLSMFMDYEQKLHMFTYYKQVYICLLSIRTYVYWV